MPKADIRRLFDHLVSTGKERWLHDNAQCFRSLEVDHKFKLGRLKYWQIGWSVPPKNSAGVKTHLAVRFSGARSVADEAANRGEFPPNIHRGHRMMSGEANELRCSRQKKRSGSHKKSAGVLANERRKSGIDFVFAARVKNYELLSNFAGCCLGIGDLGCGSRFLGR